MNSIIKKCNKILSDYYSEKFQGLILYGSMARGQGDNFSDIDLLVLLKKPFNYFQELRKIVELLYPVQLESKNLISAKPVAKEDFEAGELFEAVKDRTLNAESGDLNDQLFAYMNLSDIYKELGDEDRANESKKIAQDLAKQLRSENP